MDPVGKKIGAAATGLLDDASDRLKAEGLDASLPAVLTLLGHALARAVAQASGPDQSRMEQGMEMVVDMLAENVPMYWRAMGEH